MPPKLFFALVQVGILGLLILAGTTLRGAESVTPADRPPSDLPERRMDPMMQARSLAMLSQVVMQIEEYVKSKDLSAIHNEDGILTAAATELSAEAETIKPRRGDEFKADLTKFCSRLSA